MLNTSGQEYEQYHISSQILDIPIASRAINKILKRAEISYNGYFRAHRRRTHLEGEQNLPV